MLSFIPATEKEKMINHLKAIVDPEIDAQAGLSNDKNSFQRKERFFELYPQQIKELKPCST